MNFALEGGDESPHSIAINEPTGTKSRDLRIETPDTGHDTRS